ncbi:hypothetical protein DITRI_Ditri09bG0060200 [Diplodiscus trichospermus]
MLIVKAYNIEAMRTVFLKLWKLKSGLVVKEIGGQLFISKFNGLLRPESINLDWCPFWVQIHGLPLGLMSKRIGVVIGKALGDVEEVDTGSEGVAWGNSLRKEGKEIVRGYGNWLRVEGPKISMGKMMYNLSSQTEEESESSEVPVIDQRREKDRTNHRRSSADDTTINEDIAFSRFRGNMNNRKSGSHNNTETGSLASDERALTGGMVRDVLHEDLTSKNNFTRNGEAHNQETLINIPINVVSQKLMGRETKPKWRRLKSPVLKDISNIAKAGKSCSRKRRNYSDIFEQASKKVKDAMEVDLAKGDNNQAKGFDCCIVVDYVGRGRGLALLWMKEARVEVLSFSRNHIDAKILAGNKEKFWSFTGFYEEPEVQRRDFTWQLLRTLYYYFSLPWLCMGDFNEIMDDHEKLEGTLRLDRGLAKEAWFSLFPCSIERHLIAPISNHLPLLFNVRDKGHRSGWSGKGFKFENMWLRYDTSKDVVEESWQGEQVSTLLEVARKIDSCPNKLTYWNEAVGNLQQKIKEKKHELERLLMGVHDSK